MSLFISTSLFLDADGGAAERTLRIKRVLALIVPDPFATLAMELHESASLLTMR